MRDAGLTAESFKGRRIRGRGVVEDRRGPALEITAPDLIEFLTGAGAALGTMSQRAHTGRAVLGALLLAALLAGCAGDQDASSLIAPVPAAAPRTTGLERQAGREHARLVAAFGGEYAAPEARRLLAEVSARLSPATERPNEFYEITLLNSPVPNAFALPSGRLYVTRGLLALANDTAEIAAVLAHEIAHVSLRHAAARQELQARSDLVSRVAADVLNDPEGGATMRDQSRFTIAGFSRSQELEADEIGVKTLARAGYDPYGAARFLQSLGRSAGGKAAGRQGPDAAPDMLATHPSTPERIALALQGARRIGAPGSATPTGRAFSRRSTASPTGRTRPTAPSAAASSSTRASASPSRCRRG
jgi:predicted Zn-dependent protease